MKFKLIIAFVMFALIFSSAACSADTGEFFDKSFDQEDVSGSDLGGFEMRYMLNPITHWTGGTNHDMFLGYDNQIGFSDLARARVHDVETEHNCVIEIVNKTELHDYAKPILMSGSYLADALAGVSDMWGEYAGLGCFVGLSNVNDRLDITDEAKWGYKAFVESMYMDDDLYGLVPMSWPDLVSTNIGYPIVFNGNLISLLGVRDPREYHEMHKWTYDTFFECLDSYTVQEGGETKYYGYVGDKRRTAEVFLYSDGAENVQYEDGRFSFGLHGARGQAGMEAAQRLVFGDMKYTYDRSFQYDVLDRFLENRDVMGVFYVGKVFGADGVISTQMDNYGFMPWPHGPDVEDDYTYGLIENIYTAFTLPVTGKDCDATATILNMIYEPLEGYETYENIVEYMTKSYFFDDRDAKVFFDMLENCKYNYFAYLGERPYLYLEMNNQSIAEFIESYEDEIADIFENRVMRKVNGVIAVHGDYFYDSTEH